MTRSKRLPCLYQQVRLNLESDLPDSIIDVSIPSSASLFASRNSPKRRRTDRSNVTFDEDEFSRLCLATEADIFFGAKTSRSKKPSGEAHRFRSLLWRVLDQRSCLELQAVDLLHDGFEEKFQPLTIHLRFEHKIRAGGVAVAEIANDDTSQAQEGAMLVFVVTVAGELFTLRLDASMFLDKNILQEGDQRNWCNIQKPSALTYKTPFRMVARSSSQLWITLADGGILRLDKPSSDLSVAWRETFFTEGGWKASVKGLIPWKAPRTIGYGDMELNVASATSIQLSPDRTHLWAVCLDHSLKAWNINTGRVTVNIDLANDTTRDLRAPPDYTIDPVQSQLTRIIQLSSTEAYLLITFSPKTQAFNLRKITDADAGSEGIQDLSSDVSLAPPIEKLVNATIWNLDTFQVHASFRGSPMTMWINVRCGNVSHVLSVTFDLEGSAESLQRQWRDNWALVDSGNNTAEALKANLAFPTDADLGKPAINSQSTTEKWVDFLFYPGRFTHTTLETALVIYQNGMGQRLRNGRNFALTRRRPLIERICNTVSGTVSLLPGSDDTMAYDDFSKQLDTQWRAFYGVVQDLHKRRDASLTLSFDQNEALPWLIMADSVAPIRKYCDAELLWHNRQTFSELRSFKGGDFLLQNLSEVENANVGRLCYVASMFRSSLSTSFLNSFRFVAKYFATSSNALPPADQIQSLYDDSGFDVQVNDEHYNRLTSIIDAVGGFKALSTDQFLGMLEVMKEHEQGFHRKKLLAQYGVQALLRGAQSALELDFAIVFDLLLLLVFLTMELDAKDLAKEDFNSARIFTALMEKMRELQLLMWLAQKSSHRPRRAVGGIANGEEGANAQLQTPTLLESIFLDDWANLLMPNAPEIVLITYWCRAWVYGSNPAKNYDSITAHVLASLIKDGALDLAVEFLPFPSATPWTTYLKGRLYLARSDFAKADVCFKQSAKGLATSIDLETQDRAHLLDEDERADFGSGSSRYFKHVADLFETVKAYSYVADFAKLALQPAKGKGSDSSDTRILHSLLWARLFRAGLKTSRYALAYEALTHYDDKNQTRTALTSLIETMISASFVEQLLELPFAEEMAEQVDDILGSLVETSERQSKITFAPRSSEATPSIDFWKVLYSWRIKNNNFRGAATALWERLQALQAVRDTESGWQKLSEIYLMLINVLSLVDEHWAWMLVRPMPNSGKRRSGLTSVQEGQFAGGKRMIVTLMDVRNAWQSALDRRADIEAGRFAFVGADDDQMDEDVFS